MRARAPARREPLQGLAFGAAAAFSQPLQLDRTGLAGPYQIELEFDFAAALQPDYSGPSIFTALKEQLGLKLEASKGPLQVVVVDSARTPDEN